MTICNENKHGEIVYDSGYRHCPACDRIEKLLNDLTVLRADIQEYIDEKAGSSL